MTIPEKVARAICQVGCDRENCPCDYANQDQEIKEAAAGITAFLEAAAEKGWHMRPDEATEEMLSAGLNVVPGSDDWATFDDIYRAMLAPAPEFEVDK